MVIREPSPLIRTACTGCGLERYLTVKLLSIGVYHLSCGGVYIRVDKSATEFTGRAGATIKIKKEG